MNIKIAIYLIYQTGKAVFLCFAASQSEADKKVEYLQKRYSDKKLEIRETV
jgi:hypothetical protein